MDHSLSRPARPRRPGPSLPTPARLLLLARRGPLRLAPLLCSQSIRAQVPKGDSARPFHSAARGTPTARRLRQSASRQRRHTAPPSIASRQRFQWHAASLTARTAVWRQCSSHSSRTGEGEGEGWPYRGRSLRWSEDQNYVGATTSPAVIGR